MMGRTRKGRYKMNSLDNKLDIIARILGPYGKRLAGVTAHLTESGYAYSVDKAKLGIIPVDKVDLDGDRLLRFPRYQPLPCTPSVQLHREESGTARLQFSIKSINVDFGSGPWQGENEIGRALGEIDYFTCLIGWLNDELRVEVSPEHHPRTAVIASPDTQELTMALEDGRTLKAWACPGDGDTPPSIRIRLEPRLYPNRVEELCFVEFNRERAPGHELSVCAYGEEEPDALFYRSYRLAPGQRKDGTGNT